METNVLKGARINERFITAADERVTLIREVEHNYEFRYMMRGENGDRIYYNVDGRTPLNYDPARYIVRKFVPYQPVYAEVPVGPWLTPPSRPART